MAKRWAICKFGFYEEPEDMGGPHPDRITPLCVRGVC